MALLGGLASALTGKAAKGIAKGAAVNYAQNQANKGGTMGALSGGIAQGLKNRMQKPQPGVNTAPTPGPMAPDDGMPPPQAGINTGPSPMGQKSFGQLFQPQGMMGGTPMGGPVGFGGGTASGMNHGGPVMGSPMGIRAPMSGGGLSMNGQPVQLGNAGMGGGMNPMWQNMMGRMRF